MPDRDAFTAPDLDFSVAYLPNNGGIKVLEKLPEDRLPENRYEVQALALTQAERRIRHA